MFHKALWVIYSHLKKNERWGGLNSNLFWPGVKVRLPGCTLSSIRVQTCMRTQACIHKYWSRAKTLWPRSQDLGSGPRAGVSGHFCSALCGPPEDLGPMGPPAPTWWLSLILQNDIIAFKSLKDVFFRFRCSPVMLGSPAPADKIA